jgi:hypothetical protein
VEHTDIALPHDLVIWMEGLAGWRLVAAARRPGGARKEAWFVDFEGPERTVKELFLRFDRSTN